MNSAQFDYANVEETAKPLVSVVMPVRNASAYLEVAIQSILSQTYPDLEFVIVDDTSSDTSWEIIQRYAAIDQRIVPVQSPIHLKTAAALNLGWQKAQGRYVVRMDADDWSTPDRIEKQLRLMEDHPDLAVSGGAIEICDEQLVTIHERHYPSDDASARRRIFRYSPFAHPATIWRREIVQRVGGYNEAFDVAQDYDLYFRVGRHGKFANLPDMILKLRTHRHSGSQQKARRQEAITLYVRLKAHIEYGYAMSTTDKIYTFLQVLSMLIIPPRWKFWMFAWMRGS